MRIHSNILQRADFQAALVEAGLTGDGVYLEPITTHGSRRRARAFEVALRAHNGSDRYGKSRRWPNGGSRGANVGTGKAATYDEWGLWIAALYAVDPDAVVGPYGGREDFDVRTCYAY